MTHVGQKLALRDIRRLGGFLGLLDGSLRETALGHIQKNPIRAHDSVLYARGEGAIVQPNPFSIFPANAIFAVELLAAVKQFLLSALDTSSMLGRNAIHQHLLTQPFL